MVGVGETDGFWMGEDVIVSVVCWWVGSGAAEVV